MSRGPLLISSESSKNISGSHSQTGNTHGIRSTSLITRSMRLDMSVCGTLPRETPEILFIFRNLFDYVFSPYENPGVDPSRSVGEFVEPRKRLYENGRTRGIYEGSNMPFLIYRERCHLLEDARTDQKKDFIMKRKASGNLTRGGKENIILSYFLLFLYG